MTWEPSEKAPPPASARWVWAQVFAGIAIVMALHLAVVLFLAGVAMIGELLGVRELQDFPMVIGGMWILAIGLAQMVYVTPVFVTCFLVRRRTIAAGVAIGAALTFLLNGACYGLFCGAMAFGI